MEREIAVECTLYIPVLMDELSDEFDNIEVFTEQIIDTIQEQMDIGINLYSAELR